MFEKLSFKQTVWTGVVLAALCGVAMAGAGFYALHAMSSIQDEIITDHAADVTQVARLALAIERHFGSEKAYLLTGQEEFLQERAANERDLAALLERMPAYVTTAEGRRRLAAIDESAKAYRGAMDAAVAKRQSGASADETRRFFESDVAPKRRALDAAIAQLEGYKVDRLDASRALTGELYEHGRKVLLRAYIFGIFALVALGTIAARLLIRLQEDAEAGRKARPAALAGSPSA